MEYQGYDDPRTDNVDQQQPEGNAVEQQVQSEDGGQAQQLPQQDAFEPTTWALNYKGQQVYPRDRQHLVDLAQQGWSYSQRMEKLNQRQQEIDKTAAKYKDYQTLDETLQQHPELAQKINQIYQEYATGTIQQQGGQQQDDYSYQDPRVGQLQNELNELKQWREQQINSQADNALNASIQALKEKYPDQPWDHDTGQGTLSQQLIQHAIDRDITDVELAYKDLMWDSLNANAQAAALKKQKEQQQQNFRNGIVDTGHTYSTQQASGGNEYNPSDDYSDLTRKAIQDLGG